MDRPSPKRPANGSLPDPKRPKNSVTTQSHPAETASTSAPTQSSKKDDKLSPEIELQRSLLRSDPALSRRFAEALRSRPADISQKTLARQFWAQRQHLLRAHAIEQEQKRAAYNVFSEVQPRYSEGVTKLNITADQVEDIFRQHPVVRRAYDESVPNKYKDNMTFWGAFFVSRLFKKLKGERIMDTDPQDVVLDKYLNISNTSKSEDTRKGQEIAEQHVPHFIDLSGNEQHHSQRLGNRPDWLMRPSRADKVPILTILNNMSEKIMAHAAPADGDPHAPIGMDEETFNELRIKDLQTEEGEDQVILNIQNRDKLHESRSSAQKDKLSQEAIAYSKQDSSKILFELKSGLNSCVSAKTHEMELAVAADVNSYDHDDDSGSDSGSGKDAQKPSKASKPFQIALRSSQRHIQDLISAHLLPTGSTSVEKLPNPLPQNLQTDINLTHHTTNEFLHYFYNALLSSAYSAQMTELTALIETLDKSLSRIEAAEKGAEDEKQEKIKTLKKEAVEKQQRLGNKRKVKWEEMGDAGVGRKEVVELMASCVKAVGAAKGKFAELTSQTVGT